MMTKHELINLTVEAILKHRGCLLYNDIIRVLRGENQLTRESLIVFFLEMSVICHNIPKYLNNAEVIREVTMCFRDAITFVASNIAEKDIVVKSTLGELVDEFAGVILPPLKFFDDTHEIFTFGRGNKNPDLVDANGVTYEVKRNYEDGSPSSLHKADFLLNCKTNTVEQYKVYHDKIPTGHVEVHYSPLARFRNALTDKITAPTPDVVELLGDFMGVIWNGELIAEVEYELKQRNFILYNNI